MDTLISDPFISVLLITVGFACLFLELFIVSFGALGALGAGACIFGIYGLFHQGHTFMAVGAIGGTVAFVVITVRFWLKRIFHRAELNPEQFTAADESMKALLGKTGTTLSELRPAGLAQLDGKKLDVVSPGYFIAEDTAVTVVDVTGNRIVVKKQSAGPGNDPP